MTDVAERALASVLRFWGEHTEDHPEQALDWMEGGITELATT